MKMTKIISNYLDASPLPTRFGLFIPYHDYEGNPLELAARQYVIAHTQALLKEIGKGYTEEEVFGGWLSSNGQLLHEKSTRLYCNTTDEAFFSHLYQIKDLIMKLCFELRQSTVAFEYQTTLFLFRAPWKEQQESLSIAA